MYRGIEYRETIIDIWMYISNCISYRAIWIQYLAMYWMSTVSLRRPVGVPEYPNGALSPSPFLAQNGGSVCCQRENVKTYTVGVEKRLGKKTGRHSPVNAQQAVLRT